MILDVFDEAYWISCDPRRIEPMRDELRRMDIVAMLFPAVKRPVGDDSRDAKRKSLCETFIRIIQEAKRMDRKSVLIMEDDCFFAPGFARYWPLCREFLLANPWDVFYFYWHPESPNFRKYANFLIVPIVETFLTHCLAINHTAYDEVIDRVHAVLGQGRGLDEMFFRCSFSYHGTKIYAPTLNLAGQRSGWSDIEQRQMDERMELAQ